MGYYSRFKCKTHLSELQIEDIERISEYSEDGCVYGNEEIKWYDFEKDVREFSSLYPDILFEWIIEGEDSCDIWKAYASDGKFCTLNAIFTFPEFEESLLQ